MQTSSSEKDSAAVHRCDVPAKRLWDLAGHYTRPNFIHQGETYSFARFLPQADGSPPQPLAGAEPGDQADPEGAPKQLAAHKKCYGYLRQLQHAGKPLCRAAPYAIDHCPTENNAP